jgi:hypothetical protein
VKGSLAKINANGTNLHVDDPPKLPANKINHTQVEDQAADHLSNPVSEELNFYRTEAKLDADEEDF